MMSFYGSTSDTGYKPPVPKTLPPRANRIPDKVTPDEMFTRIESSLKSSPYNWSQIEAFAVMDLPNVQGQISNVYNRDLFENERPRYDVLISWICNYTHTNVRDPATLFAAAFHNSRSVDNKGLEGFLDIIKSFCWTPFAKVKRNENDDIDDELVTTANVLAKICPNLKNIIFIGNDLQNTLSIITELSLLPNMTVTLICLTEFLNQNQTQQEFKVVDYRDIPGLFVKPPPSPVKFEKMPEEGQFFFPNIS